MERVGMGKDKVGLRVARMLEWGRVNERLN